MYITAFFNWEIHDVYHNPDGFKPKLDYSKISTAGSRWTLLPKEPPWESDYIGLIPTIYGQWVYIIHWSCYYNHKNMISYGYCHYHNPAEITKVIAFYFTNTTDCMLPNIEIKRDYCENRTLTLYQIQYFDKLVYNSNSQTIPTSRIIYHQDNAS